MSETKLGIVAPGPTNKPTNPQYTTPRMTAVPESSPGPLHPPRRSPGKSSASALGMWQVRPRDIINSQLANLGRQFGDLSTRLEFTHPQGRHTVVTCQPTTSTGKPTVPTFWVTHQDGLSPFQRGRLLGGIHTSLTPSFWWFGRKSWQL